MGGESQSAFTLNLCMLSPEPGAWASIKASQKPDPRAGQSRTAAESPESVTQAAMALCPGLPSLLLLHLQNPSPANLVGPHLGETSHLVEGLPWAQLVEKGHPAVGWADPRLLTGWEKCLGGWQQTSANLGCQQESWLKILQSQRPLSPLLTPGTTNVPLNLHARGWQKGPLDR